MPLTVQSMGSQRVGHDWATFTSLQRLGTMYHFSLHSQSQYSAWHILVIVLNVAIGEPIKPGISTPESNAHVSTGLVLIQGTGSSYRLSGPFPRKSNYVYLIVLSSGKLKKHVYTQLFNTSLPEVSMCYISRHRAIFSRWSFSPSKIGSRAFPPPATMYSLPTDIQPSKCSLTSLALSVCRFHIWGFNQPWINFICLILESTKKYNLNLPHDCNYSYSIDIVLSTTSD